MLFASALFYDSPQELNVGQKPCSQHWLVIKGYTLQIDEAWGPGTRFTSISFLLYPKCSKTQQIRFITSKKNTNTRHTSFSQRPLLLVFSLIQYVYLLILPCNFFLLHKLFVLISPLHAKPVVLNLWDIVLKPMGAAHIIYPAYQAFKL